jgi:hypothetical protein
VVLAGEDANDRRSLRVLLEEFCPDMRGRLVEINETVRLHQASGVNLSVRVGKLARLARARAEREKADLACLFVHEDLDAADGAHYVEAREKVQKALEAELGRAHYVLAVEEIEAWLMLFPGALSGYVSSWQVPAKYRGKDTGRLTDPKRILMREVSRGSRTYRESDAPDILKKAVELGCHVAPEGVNRSWDRLRADAGHCCRDHLRSSS